MVFALCSFVLVRANVLPDSLLQKANLEYTNGNFNEAIVLYQSLVDSGFVHENLYFNLGNSYFKQNLLPNAILYYERAYLLNPTDEDIKFNLEYAQSLTIDRIEALPVFFLKRWKASVASVFTSNGWAWISIALLAVLLGTALLFWFAHTVWVKRLTFLLGLLLTLFVILAVIFSVQEKKRVINKGSAIVFQSVVTVKSSPGHASKDIFILHAGTKVNIEKTLGDWVEIRIEDGNKGWLQKETIEII